MTGFQHTPVMQEEVLLALEPHDGGVYVDVTLGGGGHACALLEASAPSGALIGLDRDAQAVRAALERLSPFLSRLTVHHAPFSQLQACLASSGISQVDGVLADLGVSSHQLDVAERGFSFQHDGPLDMRMDQSHDAPLQDMFDRADDTSLADTIYQFSDERRSRPIARSILAAHKRGSLQTTSDLRNVVWAAARGGHAARLATVVRTFQALRIAVNKELEELQTLLKTVPSLLADGGVFAVIAFHSIEDRVVKHALRMEPALKALHKKPQRPSVAEQKSNRRARSARLRSYRKVEEGNEAA